MGKRGLAGNDGTRRVAVFLDRDGTINRSRIVNAKPYPPRDLSEFEFLPGAVDAIQQLHDNGFMTIIVTNQPDVGRGTQTRSVVESINSYISERCPIDDIRVCYDGDEASSLHYKPKPGMLLDAAADFDIDLSASFMVGDRWRDIGAGQAAGCKTILLKNQYSEEMIYVPDIVVITLQEAASIIVSNVKK